PANGGRTPILPHFYRAALPERAGQRVRGRGAADCASSRVQRTNGAQRGARFQPPGRGVSAARVLPAPDHPRALTERGGHAAPAFIAPESTGLWPSHQSVDLGASRRGEFCPRSHRPAGQPRSDPHGFTPLRGELATGQALAYQSRADLGPQKKARDRLIRIAASHPEWAVGFEAEPWGSRLAQPALPAWPPAHQPLHLVEQTAPATDPDPKALACYG